jgi:serine/threonine protein kinase
VNANNVCILGSGDSLQVVLIDFGNCSNGDPSLKPLMSNDDEHISPWLLLGRGAADIHSDLYALGVLAHEALLIRTIDTGSVDIKEMRQRRAKGVLAGDPLSGNHKGDDQGLPFGSLSPRMQTLIRGLVAPERHQQPTIEDFKRIFDSEIAHNLVLCSGCNNPYWWHVSLVECPCCRVASVPPALHVCLPDRVLPLRSNLQIGRNDLPGAPLYFSAKQLVIQPAHLGAAGSSSQVAMA